jgi:hypothetical protein
MHTARVSPYSGVAQFFANILKNWRERRARLAEFDSFDPSEMQRIARDLNIPVSGLRTLAGHDKNAADLLQRRLRSLNLDTATIEPAVMRDLQRCCANCTDKVRCEHELEDQPKAASWPKYCPNEQTIEAIVAEKRP